MATTKTVLVATGFEHIDDEIQELLMDKGFKVVRCELDIRDFANKAKQVDTVVFARAFQDMLGKDAFKIALEPLMIGRRARVVVLPGSDEEAETLEMVRRVTSLGGEIVPEPFESEYIAELLSKPYISSVIDDEPERPVEIRLPEKKGSMLGQVGKLVERVAKGTGEKEQEPVKKIKPVPVMNVVEEQTIPSPESTQNDQLDEINEAYLDYLTGCLNRRYLDKYGTVLEARFCVNMGGTGEKFSILVADIDHFKKANDTYGHMAGDEVLKAFAAHLIDGVGDLGVVHRYGGEEFVIVFPGIDRDEAMEIGEDLRRTWQDRTIVVEEESTGTVHRIQTTFSGGIAEIGVDGQSLKSVVEQADKALYQAKRGGRNRIYFAGMEPVEPVESVEKVEKVKPAGMRWGKTGHGEQQVPSSKRGRPWEEEEKPVEPKPVRKTGGWMDDKRGAREPQEQVNREEVALGDVADLADLFRSEARVVTVWNSNGYHKAETALEIARRYRNVHKRVALLEFDTVNPALDELMKVPMPCKEKSVGKEYWEIGVGLLTMGKAATPEEMVEFMHQYRYELWYLPAGNRLLSERNVHDVRFVQLGDVAWFERLLEVVSKSYDRIVICVANDMTLAGTTAALRNTDAIVVPVEQPRAQDKHVRWLERLEKPIVEHWVGGEERGNGRGLAGIGELVKGKLGLNR